MVSFFFFFDVTCLEKTRSLFLKNLDTNPLLSLAAIPCFTTPYTYLEVDGRPYVDGGCEFVCFSIVFCFFSLSLFFLDFSPRSRLSTFSKITAKTQINKSRSQRFDKSAMYQRDSRFPLRHGLRCVFRFVSFSFAFSFCFITFACSLFLSFPFLSF